MREITRECTCILCLYETKRTRGTRKEARETDLHLSFASFLVPLERERQLGSVYENLRVHVSMLYEIAGERQTVSLCIETDRHLCEIERNRERFVCVYGCV